MSVRKRIETVLNKLIQANNIRAEVYRKAYNYAADAEMKILFNKNFSHSLTNINSLSREAGKLGLHSSDYESATDIIYRLLLDLRASLSAYSKRSILNFCAENEQEVMSTYEKALKETNVSQNEPLQEILYAQMDDVREARDAIQKLKGH